MTDSVALTTALADRYRIEREIGAGGMATVYLAHDLKHDRKVAVKVLKPELGAVLGADRFLAEIKVTANLQHPNLLPLFDSGAAGGLLYYVMPYIEGETLRGRLDREQQLPVDETIRLVALMAGALDFAHARGVIHRDLKPENVLLQAGQPVIADFGSALAVAQAGGSRVTETGLSLGTPHYMSPEQATGDRVIDARSDQYSLGAVTYEMLTGEPPHTGKTAQAIIARLLTETPRSVRSTRPAASPALDAAIQRALVKAPADRFASCGDFARALAAGAVAAPFVDTASAPPSAARAAAPRSRRMAIGVVAVAMLLVVVAGVVYATRRAQTLDSIVVLPFGIRTNDPDGEYISDGITESISNSLTHLPGIKVIPVSVAQRYKGKSATPQQIGDELKVAAVLTGRITHRGDTLTIGVELDDTHDGKQLWGSQYTRRVADLLALQRDIASEVSQHLRQNSDDMMRRMQRGSTNSPEAYQLYLKGTYYTAKNSKDGFDRGAAYFKQAIAIDSNYALAWAGLSFNYVAATDWFVRPLDALPLSRGAATRALAIDSTLASARLALGMIDHWYGWDWASSERQFQRTIAMAPAEARPHVMYAWLMSTLGRYDEAVAEARKGVVLDPVSAEISNYMGMMLVYASKYDEAIAQLRATLDLDPTYWYANEFLGRAYEQTGKMTEAIAEYEKAVALEKANAENWSNLGHAYAKSGRAADARRIIADLKARSAKEYVAPYDIAVIYVGLGDKDEAFAWLNRAVDERSALPVLYMTSDKRWDKYRADPRYQAVIKRIGLPAAAGNR